MKKIPDLTTITDQELKKLLKHNGIALNVEEARHLQKSLGRTPTFTELTVWSIQGSEHCSYKSSRRYLRLLPTKAPNVILGPGEDSGIVEIARVKNDRYGLVISHESHNHPSQIVPFEGAATGVGGCVRDVVCMGARVMGILDSLRFGDLKRNETRQIVSSVVSGIGGYGNPIGVPNLGGDTYFDEKFNDNCLVNVAAIGLVKESEIIHSFVPEIAAREEWDIIIVGKPTDMSGMGGAAFASFILDEAEKEKNKGAVQEPNPFLKRHLLVSTYDLFTYLQKKKLISKTSFKDMGAGGITCSTVEQVAKSNLGAEIDLSKVNVAFENLDPSVIACAETQERFTWICHPSLTQIILDHYNQKWDLPAVAENARACVIGKVTNGNYILVYRGEEYLNAKAKLVTEALQYDRPWKEPKRIFKEPKLNPPKNYNQLLLQLLSSENIASRKPIYERYDKQVQGYTVIEAGEADASLITPLIDEKVDAKIKKIGLAFSTASNPRQGLISPYHAAANAAVLSMRNVAAVGAYPQALTDCLNYGNPEKPDQMWELKMGIEGLAAACNAIKLKNYPSDPTPIISGNVSLYNEGKNGHIPPSAIVCCIGKIDDSGKAITMQFKKAGHKLFLLGERKNELGGSEYYRLHGHLGANVPVADFVEAQKEIYTLVDAVAQGLVASAHNISEGGMAMTLCKMAFGGRGEGKIGFEIDLGKVPGHELTEDIKLFSETGGFVVEISPADEKKFLAVCKKNRLQVYEIGRTTKTNTLTFKSGTKTISQLSVDAAAKKWLNGMREKL